MLRRQATPHHSLVFSFWRSYSGSAMQARSYWIPGASAPTVFEKRSAFLRPLKKKGFKEERVAKVEGDDLDTSTTLESNKSLIELQLLEMQVTEKIGRKGRKLLRRFDEPVQHRIGIDLKDPR